MESLPSKTMKKDLKRRKYAQRIHFRRRIKERLGFDLSKEEIQQIKSDIELGFVTPVASHLERLDIYRVTIAKRPCIVVYDTETRELATFLTNKIWQEQIMSNTPYSKDQESLRESLGDTPAGKVLTALIPEDE